MYMYMLVSVNLISSSLLLIMPFFSLHGDFFFSHTHAHSTHIGQTQQKHKHPQMRGPHLKMRLFRLRHHKRSRLAHPPLPLLRLPSPLQYRRGIACLTFVHIHIYIYIGLSSFRFLFINATLLRVMLSLLIHACMHSHSGSTAPLPPMLRLHQNL